MSDQSRQTCGIGLIICLLLVQRRRGERHAGEQISDSELDLNSETDKNSIAWLMDDIGASIIGRGIGGADGSKKPGKKKIKNKITTKLTKPTYFKTSFINEKIVAEFKMVLSGKEGKNVQIDFKPWILTEEGKVFARLTYNPYFDTMMGAIEQLLEIDPQEVVKE